MNWNTKRIAIVAVALLAGSATGLAGELSPPAGPVSSTMKTLQQVEPRTVVGSATTPGNAGATFRITAPGSYYLAADVLGEAGKHGIEIAAGNVTLDLNGFTLAGNGSNKSGVRVAGGLENVSVRNGRVSGWALYGVEMNAKASTLEGVTSAGNGDAGISVAAESTVRQCTSVDNGGSGVNAMAGSIISSCIASNNAGAGIIMFQDAEISGGTIERCEVRNNGQIGVVVATRSVIRECEISENDDSGLYVGGDSHVVQCTVTGNAKSGIEGAERLTVEQCSVHRNSQHGISVGQDSLIRGNHCSGNGWNATGAGIHKSLLGRCVIEDNVLQGNDYGVWIEGSASNLVRRNTAMGNSVNFQISAGNLVAPIVAPPASSQINGSGAAGLGTTDASANISQ